MTTKQKLKQAEAERSGINARIAQIETDLKNANTQLTAARRRLTTLNSKYATLQKQIVASQAAIKKLPPRTGLSPGLKSRTRTTATSALTTQANNLAAQVASQNTVKSGIATANADIIRLTSEVQVLSTALAVENQTLQQQDIVIDKLQSQQAQIDQLHEVLGAMPGTGCPATLLPVRLETRFITSPAGTDLCVRIFPDVIHIDTHEPELTEAEETFGKHYWQQRWKAADDEARSKTAWAQLAQRFDPHRAAWIASVTQPINPQDKPQTSIAPEAALAVEPQFPDIARREQSWTRAPRVRALPDRWVLSGFRDGERVLLNWGEPIAKNLAVGPDPSLAPDAATTESDLAIDEGMKWLVDFDTALAAGMAMRITLDTLSTQRGFDELYVIGLNCSTGFSDSAEQLTQLLDAQHYTDGMAFVPPDTPSNNMTDVKSGFSNTDPVSESSYQLNVKANGVPATEQSNAQVTASALGISAQTFSAIAHADSREQSHARAMNTALWSATLGYFFEQMLGDAISMEGLLNARSHFIQFVRAGGALPVLRVGKQPYGILATTSLDQWVSPKESFIKPAIVDILKDLRQRFNNKIGKIPYIGRSSSVNTADEDIRKILSQDANSSDYQGRLLLDSAFFGHPNIPDINKALPADVSQRYQSLKDVLLQLKLKWNPRLFDTVLTDHIMKLDIPLLQRELENDVNGPPADYIDWILNPATGFKEIVEGFVTEHGVPDSLLYKLLRHAALLEYANAAHQVLFNRSQAANPKRGEPSLINIMHGPSSLLEMNQVVADLGSQPVGDIIHTLDAENFPEVAQLAEFHDSLSLLRELDSNQLQQLLAGTLDLGAYRLDAWVSSLANYKLAFMRSRTSDGTTLGGYGWVQDLRPDHVVMTQSDGAAGAGNTTPAVEELDGGYIHAPSMNQAVTAAILRAGYLAKKSDTNDDPFAVNLSSDRVRLAQWLLDGVRQGQSMSALLGYRFERGLHENHQGMELDRYIEPFRKIAAMSDIYKARADQDKARSNAAQMRSEAEALTQQANQQIQIADNTVKALTSQRASLSHTLAQKQKQANDLKIKTAKPPVKDVGKIFEDYLANKALLATVNSEIADLNQKILAKDAQIDAAKKNQALVVAKANVSLSQANKLTQDAQLEDQHLQDAIDREKQLLKQQRDKILLDQKNTTAEELGSLESIAATRVVDGLALQHLYKKALVHAGQFVWSEDTIPFGQFGLPVVDTPDYHAILAELNILDQSVDAVGDALSAESVYQMVQGNTLRTAATLDAVAGNEVPPPELDFVRTPRSGIGITHRVAVIFEGLNSNVWPGDELQVRAVMEPALNMWCSEKLGQPERIQFKVEYRDPNDDTTLVTRLVTMAEFGMSALDMVYCVNHGLEVAVNELERRIQFRLLRTLPAEVPADVVIHLDFDRQADWSTEQLSLAEVMHMAEQLAHLITSSRAMDANDISPPEDEAISGMDLNDLQNRVAQLLARFDNDVMRLHNLLADEGDIATEELCQAMFALSNFDFINAVPAVSANTDAAGRNAVLRQAASLLKDAEARAAKLAAMVEPEGSIEAKRNHALRQIEVLLGRSFKVLYLFTTSHTHSVTAMFENSLLLQNNNPLAVTTWLQRLARVRPGVERMHNVKNCNDAINPDHNLKLSVGQMPYQPGDLWNALDFAAHQDISHDAVSMVAELVPAANKFGTDVYKGLLIDEWTEIVPQASETSAIAFNYDAPGSAAPQSILLAVPPDNQKSWNFEILESIVRETLALSKVRCIDPDMLDQEFRHIFPALYFTLNLQGESISTDFQPTAQPT